VSLFAFWNLFQKENSTGYYYIRREQNKIKGCAMAQLVSFWPLIAEAQVHVGFVVDKGTRADFPLSVSFCHGSPYSCIIYEMKNRPVGSRCSQT
jgi:hypothetical protein